MNSIPEQDSDHDKKSKHSDDGSDSASEGSEVGDQALEEKVSRPLIANPWKSDTSEQHEREIKGYEVRPTRPLIKYQFIKKRKEFGLSYRFGDKDASDQTYEIRIQHDNSFAFQVKKKVSEIGLQAAAPLDEATLQTNFNRKLNMGVMAVGNDKEPENFNEENPEFLTFLERAYGMVEEALQSNEMINVFEDDFAVLPKEEKSAEAVQISTESFDIKQCTYLKCKGKRVASIRMQPPILGVKTRFVACSFNENWTFEEQIELEGRAIRSTMLLWDIEDVNYTSPVLELESPYEVTCFEFHPSNPYLIIAGTTNGRVLRYNIETELSNRFVITKFGKKLKQEKKETNIILKPHVMSALQEMREQVPNVPELIKRNPAPPRTTITAVKWLPEGYELDRKNIFTLHKKRKYIYDGFVSFFSETDVHQFFTMSRDGQYYFWDMDPTIPHEKNPITNPDVPWRAAFSIQLFRPEGSGGVMSGSLFQFLDFKEVPNEKKLQSPLVVGTSGDGDLYLFDWTIRPTDDMLKVELVTKIWTQERSYRPCVGLDRMGDIILTLHDFHFCLWKIDCDVPVFHSPFISGAQILCGCFSPTRPGVIYIGKSDGWLDVWDLTDQSHKETMKFQISSKGISALLFHKLSPNVLIAGDFDGTVHAKPLPANLIKKLGSEDATMSEFFRREVKRVEYFSKRFEIRDEEEKLRRIEEEKRRDLEEYEETQKKEGNVKEDIEEKMNKEYEEFVDQFLIEIGEKQPPPKEEVAEKPAKRR